MGDPALPFRKTIRKTVIMTKMRNALKILENVTGKNPALREEIAGPLPPAAELRIAFRGGVQFAELSSRREPSPTSHGVSWARLEECRAVIKVRYARYNENFLATFRCGA